MGTFAPEGPLDRDMPAVAAHGTATLDDLRSVGILGGTFNPPHLGHLALARSAREDLGLDRVVMMPAQRSPHKRAVDDPGAEHRLRMCRLSAERVDGISVCALEIERAGPSYTVDTLEAIHASHPDAQLTFIAGADTARTLPAWREPAKLLGLADLAVAARGSAGRRGVLDAVAPLFTARPAPGGRRSSAVRFLQMGAVEVSSSMVRERVARGEPIEHLVGSAVAGYIAEHDLYRDRRRVAP
jgi:nicotinate-nucleotide adenylyltransferase